MTKTWFTSDTHFGHAKLLTSGHRWIGSGITTIEQADEQIIKRWNLLVGRGDTVYHLGDFAWHDLALYRRQLNGQIHLILGNHDRLKSSDYDLFESVSDMKTAKVGDQKIVCCHYAMRVWNQSHRGRWHLYGHSHGSLADDPNSMSLDIGMDCWDFCPVSFEGIAGKMAKKTFKPIDHHTE